MRLEICADTIEGALIAEKAGATRIEWCANLSEGGVTPSAGLIFELRRKLHIDMNVIIRPRGGDFLYDDDEFRTMMADIRYCGDHKADGVVIGMLTADGRIDLPRNRELVQLANALNMTVTFHRAFDRTRNLFEALDDVMSLGCDRILTSGGQVTAMEGADTIRQLIERAGNGIIIMPGAGVTSENAAELLAKTGATELHGTFRSRKEGKMLYRSPAFAGMDNEYNLMMTDGEKIRGVG